MPRFRYTAVGPDGRALAGEIEANDAGAAAAEFGGRGIMLQSLDRLKEDGAGLLSSPPSPRSITRFLGELALMLRSGLPLDEALDLSAQGQPARLGRIWDSSSLTLNVGGGLARAGGPYHGAVGSAESSIIRNDRGQNTTPGRPRVATGAVGLLGVFAADQSSDTSTPSSAAL